MTTIVLDAEAVEGLSNPRSAKHQRMLAYIEADRGARRRQAPRRRILVPATVRVEAGWDRTSPRAAVINRLGIDDHLLSEHTTNVAARLRTTDKVSPADAHVGAVIADLAGQDIVVITSDPSDPSDPGDIGRVAGSRAVRIITI